MAYRDESHDKEIVCEAVSFAEVGSAGTARDPIPPSAGPPAKGMSVTHFTRITPRFPVADLRRTMEFYKQILGFHEDVLFPEDKPTFGILQRDEVSLGFFVPDEHRPNAATGNGEFYIDVEDVQGLHEAVKGRVAIEWGPEVYFYGRREFAIRDPDGYLVIFTEPTDDPPTCHGEVSIMAYSDFTIDEVKARFKLQFDEGRDLFGQIPAIEVSDFLRQMLAENVPLALAISTEKARSELIIAPVLLEARRQAKQKTSVFSGVDFSVDPEQGLKGVCDFLLSRSPEQLTIEAPVVAVVEAKNENMKAGIAQCVAEMIAVQLFNKRKGKPVQAVYGAVTTGSNWKFLRLQDTAAEIDLAEYYINDVARIVGILVAMLQGA